VLLTTEDAPENVPDKQEENVDNVPDKPTDKSNVDEQISPKKETSCFDFKEDDEEMPLKSPPTRRRSRKSVPSTDLATAPIKFEELESSSANTSAVAEQTVDKCSDTDDVIEQAAELAEKEDEALKSEIASLLKETEVLKIPSEIYGKCFAKLFLVKFTKKVQFFH
jgi:hypothetical protein